MFAKILHKEILLHLREARFAWVAGLFCGLVLLGFLLMSQDYSRRLQGYRSSVDAERRQILVMDTSRPVRNQVRALTNDRGIYAFRPPQPLAPLASGLESATPTQIHVSDTRSWSRQASEVFYRNPLLVLFPRPDFAYIVGAILSLVALFFTFDAVCGEKQSGTLRLMFSTGVSRDQVLLGKWVGAVLTLGAPFLLATALGLLILTFVGHVELHTASLVRIASIVALALIYLSLFVTLGLAISVLARRPSASLLICLTVWVGTAFVLPHLLASMGAAAAPTPAFQQIKLQKRALDEQRQKQQVELRQMEEAGKITAEERQRRQQALWEETEDRKARIDENYARQVDHQADISQAFSRLSPVVSFAYAASELSGTGLDFYHSAQEAFQRHRKDFREYARNMKRRADAGELKADWLRSEDIPRLTIRPRDLAETFGAVTAEILVLIAFQIAAFALAYVRFLYYDVR